jgi:hypothetical protein
MKTEGSKLGNNAMYKLVFKVFIFLNRVGFSFPKVIQTSCPCSEYKGSLWQDHLRCLVWWLTRREKKPQHF